AIAAAVDEISGGIQREAVAEDRQVALVVHAGRADQRPVIGLAVIGHLHCRSFGSSVIRRSEVRSADGAEVSPADGAKVRSTDGAEVGSTDGAEVSPADGAKVRSTDGAEVGSTDGAEVSPAD